mgnify:CR=1 FL=1
MLANVTKYLCIGCPLGCQLEVEHTGKDIHRVSGYSCRRGKEFAESEHTDPRRTLTTTVHVVGGAERRLPVKTEVPIPKHEVSRLCDELRKINVQAPVRQGDVVVADALGLGIDVVATRDIQAAPRSAM